MYLMALANADYVLATIFFALIFLTAYIFRRKQQTANKFLFAADELPYNQNNSWILGFGVIELIAAGAIGAIYGMSGIYHILTIILAGFIIIYYISKQIYPYSIYEYLSKTAGVKFSAFYAILCVIFLLFWLSITVVLTSKIFLSLLGWSFVNSVFGITLITIISLEVGGYASVRYNRYFWLAIISLAFIIVFALAVNTLSSTGVVSLGHLALSQGKPQNFYTTFNDAFHLSNLLGASIAIMIILPLITAVKASRRLNPLPVTILKLSLFVLMIVCGIMAIATPVQNINGSDSNSKIVTYQAQLPDGQMGYIVKSIDAKNDFSANQVPGIVPPLLNAKTNLIEPGKYDYKLANIVIFRHYLPANMMFLVVLTIMVAFMYTLAHYLLSIAKIITFDICPSLNLLTEYGEEGKLWNSRMSVIFAGAISIFGGYFLQSWFNLVNLAYIVCAFAAVLIVILIIAVIKYGKK